jgi:hypothetical protein
MAAVWRSGAPALAPRVTYPALSEVAQAANRQLHGRMAGLCYDRHRVEEMLFPVAMLDKTLLALSKTFIRKSFCINLL